MFIRKGFVSPFSAWDLFRRHERGRDETLSQRDLDRKADLAFVTFLRRVPDATILLRDGKTVHVDYGFLGRIFSTSPFSHRYFDLQTGQLRPALFRHALALLYSAISGRTTAWSNRLFAGLTVMAIIAVLLGVQPFYQIPASSKAAQNVPDWFVSATKLVGLIFALLWWLSLKSYEARRLALYRGGHLMFQASDVVGFIQKYYRSIDDTEDAVANDPGEDGAVQSAVEVASLDPELECAFAIVREQDRLAEQREKLLKEKARALFGVGLGVRAFDRAWNEARRLRPELGQGGRPEKKP
ncbi:MAG TPA: hypothetical protein PK043_11380 [Alicycliphilus sp.]|nr:hypothetical protein [Alicycliphilus sp.]